MTEEEINGLINENKKLKEEKITGIMGKYEYTSGFAKDVIFEVLKKADDPEKKLEEIVSKNPDTVKMPEGKAPPVFSVETIFEEEVKKPSFGGFWHRK